MNNDKEYDGLFDEDIDVVSNNDTKDDLNTEDISSDNVDNAEDNQDKQYKEDKLKRKEREDKLLKVFGTEMTVHKNLKKTSFFKSYNIPSFLRDWLLEKFRDGDDFDSDGIKEYIKSHIPNKEGFFVIKDKIMKSAELAKILTRVGVDLDVLTNKNRFSMPEYLRMKQILMSMYGIILKIRLYLVKKFGGWLRLVIDNQMRMLNLKLKVQ